MRLCDSNFHASKENKKVNKKIFFFKRVILLREVSLESPH